MTPKCIPVSQMGRFLLVGVSNTILSFSVFQAMFYVLPAGVSRGGLAQAVSYSAGTIWSYLLNSQWTFAHPAERDHRRIFTKFAMIQFSLLALSSLLMYFLVDQRGCEKTLSWVYVMAGATVANFLMLRYWVFIDSQVKCDRPGDALQAHCDDVGRDAGAVVLAGVVGAALIGISVWSYHFAFARFALGNGLWHRMWDDYQTPSAKALLAVICVILPSYVAVVYLLLGCGGGNRILRILRHVGRRPWCALCVGVTLLILWNVLVSKGRVRSPDDTTYLFQSQLFAHGRLTLDVSMLPNARELLFWNWTVGDDALYSFQLPGHSMILAMAHCIGLRSVCGIMEWVVAGVAIYGAANRFWGRKVSLIAIWLHAISPWAIVVFSGYTVSTSTAMLVALALWSWGEVRAKPDRWLAWLGLAIAMGFLSWVRLTAVLFIGIPIALDCLFRAFRRDVRWSRVGCSAVVFFCAFVGYVIYCSQQTGTLSLTPGGVYSNRLQSEEFRLMNILLFSTMFSALKSVGNIALTSFPFPFGPIIAGVCLVRFYPRTRGTIVNLLLVMLALMLLFYCTKASILTWYLFELSPVIFLLGALGLHRGVTRWRQRERRGCAGKSQRERLIAAGVLAVCCSILPAMLLRDRGYMKTYCLLADEVARAQLPGARNIIVLGDSIPPVYQDQLLGFNDPMWQGPVIYLRNGSPDLLRPAVEELRCYSPVDAIYKLEVQDVNDFLPCLKRIDLSRAQNEHHIIPLRGGDRVIPEH